MKNEIQATISYEQAEKVSLGDEVEFDKLTDTGGVVLGRYKVTKISKTKDGTVAKITGVLTDD